MGDHCGGPTCHVFGKTTKQGNKGRPVVFGAAYNENDFITGGWRTARKRAGLDCTKGQALHFHDLRAEAACRLYEATGGDARRVMHFLDHRSLDETQKYIDRLVAHTERENADIMATFERRTTKEASGAPTPPANSRRHSPQRCGRIHRKERLTQWRTQRGSRRADQAERASLGVARGIAKRCAVFDE